jgi:hypothetical protein
VELPDVGCGGEPGCGVVELDRLPGVSVAKTLFSDTTSNVMLLVEQIRRGDLALPDIQRPFVWPTTKMRDLLDSMYRGYPVGFLLFWNTDADTGARPIGIGDKHVTVPKTLIVDGQQRLTSLFAIFTGTKVVRSDYSEGRVRIAFRPTDASFGVTDAAIEKDAEYIPDISELWSAEGGRRKTLRSFLRRLREKRGVTQDEEDQLEEAIDGVFDLQHYPFKIVELSAQVDEERVAEIFVRINSEGVTLNQADFILTLMSVWWEKGRRQLEEFSRAAKRPALSASPFNYYIQPSAPQLLRVSVALAFRRAVLRTVYVLLRGRDLETGEVDPQRRDEQFARLAAAQDKALDLTNWHEFLQSLERAGFRSAKMVSAENVILFSYALFLIGRVDYQVPLDRLREVMARWFFMAQTTARYSGSFESQFESDVARLAELKAGDADGFIRLLNRVVDDTLSNDFWTITLPNELATSASKSPALMAYIAALNILDADALLSTGKVRSRLDPAVIAKKGIERHHLFPRAYLRDHMRITETRRINQIANMALVEWSDNIKISDDAPDQYWPAQLAAKNLDPHRLIDQLRHHALPDGWEQMSYDDFLSARRRLMGLVVKEAFSKLGDTGYSPKYPEVPTPPGFNVRGTPDVTAPGGSSLVGLRQLLDAELLRPNSVLAAANSPDTTATVTPDGQLNVDGVSYNSPTEAARAVTDEAVNGWTYWLADTPEGQLTLDDLRGRHDVDPQ